MRRNLKIWEKQASKDYRIKFVRYDEIGSVEEAMKIFFQLHQKRQVAKGEYGVFASNVNQSFHMDIAESFAKRDWLALFFLTFNDTPVAAVYSFEYGQKLYAYLCGFDPEYSIYRPGHLVFSKIMQYGIRKNLTQFDFLRGDEEYKARWKAMVRHNLKFNIAKNGIRSRFYNWGVESKPLSHLYGARTTLSRSLHHNITVNSE
jgi:CelD/BcsL family acetyltransferase involved in cellulose biosynthesis